LKSLDTVIADAPLAIANLFAHSSRSPVTSRVMKTRTADTSASDGVVDKKARTVASSEQAKVDDLLIRRFVDGDLRAFEILVVKYQRRIAASINSMVRNDSVAEELTQETFLRAYRGLANFRFESAFSTWLYAIARNTATSYHRDGHGRADNAVSLDALTEEFGSDDALIGARAGERTASSPEDEVATQQLLARIQIAVNDLPAQMRDALLLREMEGLSYVEIAEKLGVPLNTVRSLIFRARESVANDINSMLDSTIRARLD
jgi:RNA polymerase sigma-70 factor, ECF subfamily